MSQQYDNTNTAIAFLNEQKESDKHPDFSGTVNIEGKEYWLNLWKNKSKNGKKFLKGKVEPKDQSKSTKRGTQGPDDQDDVGW